ncbi:uncharacterized protein E5676_scaffold145G00160 [Cucumis melo var. makuwa]|uniref:Uncharacterized protein n=1 Tax=Cucumis melo var. makuwa TaxID=1194695 RepID=A0A5D3BVC4_CUCMM|nr:uncharacterized protein E6C27_scaffold128G002950 [Cucumis melo var. makuwa]TYK02762.1 uncharacterized protein E5676_scaffold145G00160 [Cucumis melo var. makuwa]
MGSMLNDHERKFAIEQLKALGAMIFEASTYPLDAEACLNLLKKFFELMNCPKEDS